MLNTLILNLPFQIPYSPNYGQLTDILLDELYATAVSMMKVSMETGIRLEGKTKNHTLDGRTLPWELSDRAIVPESTKRRNLFVPTSPFSTHIGFSLLRVEQTFMTMGQISAFAADLTIKTDAWSAEKVDYELLRGKLDSAGFLLNATSETLPDRVSSS
ncbi:unnamed protein product [Penicillium manginii]